MGRCTAHPAQVEWLPGPPCKALPVCWIIQGKVTWRPGLREASPWAWGQKALPWLLWQQPEVAAGSVALQMLCTGSCCDAGVTGPACALSPRQPGGCGCSSPFQGASQDSENIYK